MLEYLQKFKMFWSSRPGGDSVWKIWIFTRYWHKMAIFWTQYQNFKIERLYVLLEFRNWCMGLLWRVSSYQHSNIIRSFTANFVHPLSSFDLSKTIFFFALEINLIFSCGIFITMNLGYVGRTEKPFNLRSIFRPISLFVPDTGLIAKNCCQSESAVLL